MHDQIGPTDAAPSSDDRSPAFHYVPLYARLTERLHAGRYDRDLAVGVPAEPGSPLAVHAERITCVAEREAIARSFRRLVRDAHDGGVPLCTQMEPHRRNVLAAEELIDTVTLWLHSQRPVDPRGMARLRRLLCDGAGPLYDRGRGDLEGRLVAALAAL